jgi:hypothetical protein
MDFQALAMSSMKGMKREETRDELVFFPRYRADCLANTVALPGWLMDYYRFGETLLKLFLMPELMHGAGRVQGSCDSIFISELRLLWILRC